MTLPTQHARLLEKFINIHSADSKTFLKIYVILLFEVISTGP